MPQILKRFRRACTFPLLALALLVIIMLPAVRTKREEVFKE